MTIHSILGKPLKHYASDKNNNARYVMLALENDQNPDTCVVVDIDLLTDEMRAELLEIINSDECQSVVDPWVILDKKFFMNIPNQTIMGVLRKYNKIKVLDSENVLIHLPNNKTQTPKEIANSIREYKKLKATGTKTVTEALKVNEITEAENKNAKDIAELKEQMASISETLTSLVEMMKSKKAEKK
jgi:hypothetical protein